LQFLQETRQEMR